jgi:hypothetical protein
MGALQTAQEGAVRIIRRAQAHDPVATFEDIHILEPARFAHVLAERLRL